ncbi:hypothetical protein [Amycolatopsis minnesotensis]|uniref:Uncharacterized protein n=1 Tax=Amycolatopsis minnesotensis TaxID=337894 RepID=A0ABP5DUF6_9PSEU
MNPVAVWLVLTVAAVLALVGLAALALTVHTIRGDRGGRHVAEIADARDTALLADHNRRRRAVDPDATVVLHLDLDRPHPQEGQHP